MPGRGLIVDDDVQQGRVDVQPTVILDEAELPEFIHEEIDARACRADPRRQNVLVDSWNDRFQLSLFAEIGEEQEQPGEPAFARIEQLINQISLDLNVTRQQECHEPLRKHWLFVEDPDHRGFFDSDNRRFRHRGSGGQMQGLAGQTSFAKEVTGREHGDDTFLTLLGDDRELDLACFDVVDGIRRISLPVDDLPRLERRPGSSAFCRNRERSTIDAGRGLGILGFPRHG